MSFVERGVWRELRQHQMVERLGRIGHWFLPGEARRLRWSREAARIHGCDGAPSKVELDLLLGMLSGDAGRRLVDGLEAAMARGRGFDIEATIALAAGERTVRMVGECEHDSEEQAIGVLVVVQDISEHCAALAALATAEARQTEFLETASDWLWELGPDLRFTYMSPRVEDVTGVPVGYHLGKTRREIMSDKEITPEIEAHFATLARREPFRDFRYWRSGHDGRRQGISTSGKPIFDAEGRFLGYRGSARDITAEKLAREDLLEANRQLMLAKKRADEAVADLRRLNAMLEDRNAEMARAESQIRRTALHDALTDLPNRRQLDEMLAGYARRAARTGGLIGVLHFDLDRFKQINDTLGHAAGDAVLRQVAGVLSRRAMPGDLVARVAGDEFVIVCTSCEDEASLEVLARGLIAEFEAPLLHEGRECWISASIGIAAARGEAIRPADLLVGADIALHRAKGQGRGTFCFFTDNLQREVVRYKSLADGVLAGMKRSEFVPFYQPQICAQTHRIIGVEALVRWRHPVEGLLAPSAFLGIAGDLGVVAALDRIMLEAAVDDLQRWHEQGLEIEKLSLNVSAHRLFDRDLIGGLARMTLPRGVLAFELLETAFLDDLSDTIAWNVDMLKDMGIEIELDDFGSGHASIVSLIKLGPDAIKIDRELVMAVNEDRTRCGLVRSIVEIGRSLDTRIIAEGVETAAQASLLAELGCHALQGFHFARPMPSDEFLAFARGWPGRDGGVCGAA
ncbi:MAG TPA: EAL domain-containing protein [Paracoccaceae bacterium]|nr:EAL domain-containing protein [Paracoccaceae bacterium]